MNTKHAISYGARTYNWPSIRAASKELTIRIVVAQAKARRGRHCT